MNLAGVEYSWPLALKYSHQTMLQELRDKL